mmetsp:Transcript_22202/g.41617  ORF Transcript_22202/g.41617 Transcript_22202/m.41617 type:complete len:247 (-) Transcript_22202:137-877(-)|eukprot:CAMPEP_0170169028 /NCGR_PEP_ID=MMETSP0040_2-20121228/1960_1 /TAXON_ID=641309 /ORGANISM="Lotharella oceanica, Strain CCMP622" /LENGTH=246 /DNA_ID=CAMNT_0010407525 /DNA_START=48 /DNA_END=788 /DNA_ORIENTATION=-
MRVLTASTVLNIVMALVLVGLSCFKADLGAAIQSRTVSTTKMAPSILVQSPKRMAKAHSACRNEMVGASRRSTINAGVLSAAGLLAASKASAKGVKGFQTHRDTGDKYEFLYPFGWEEIYVKGTDILYKDIIEPLETASVTIIQTEKGSIKDYGDLADVTTSLAEKVLTPPGQEVKITEAKEKDIDGRAYYQFGFTAKNNRYTRHTLVSATIDKGKYYIFVTGANERRWGTMGDKLQKVVDSFKVV